MPGSDRQLSRKGCDHFNQLLVHELLSETWFAEVSVFYTCSKVFAARCSARFLPKDTWIGRETEAFLKDLDEHRFGSTV